MLLNRKSCQNNKNAIQLIAKIKSIHFRKIEQLGIGYSGNNGSSGAGISPLKAAGVTRFKLAQDGTNYYDLHQNAMYLNF